MTITWDSRGFYSPLCRTYSTHSSTSVTKDVPAEAPPTGPISPRTGTQSGESHRPGSHVSVFRMGSYRPIIVGHHLTCIIIEHIPLPANPHPPLAPANRFIFYSNLCEVANATDSAVCRLSGHSVSPRTGVGGETCMLVSVVGGSSDNQSLPCVAR